jgi:hypothetical protein
MPRTKISEFSSTPASNTDIDSINIAENCPPSGINDAIRELMAQLKDFQTGAVGDSFNGPVGTTTAAAGAFTTLSSTGNTTLGDASGDSVTINGTATFANANPTLSAGTANGVAYLNGSKVVTSGSALVFDGTNLGVGTTSPAAKLGVAGNIFISGASSYIAFDATQSGSTPAFIQYASNSLVFGAGSSEQMRLTSTGLGIGTSSPATKLQIVSNTPIRLNNAASTSQADFSFADSGATLKVENFFGTGSAITFGTNANGAGVLERMRLDTSGNLGLGVTPNAWNNSIKALQVNNAALASFTSGGNVQTWLANNAYYDNATGWLYKNSSVGAALYAQSFDGPHNWNTAPSGTAGNAITFTQAMSLTADGNLLVGTTSLIVDANCFNYSPGNTWGIFGHASGVGSGTDFVKFYYGGGQIGSISQNGTTAVAYNTSSDYRLKNITGPVTTSGAYIDNLNPVEGTWKADGSTFVGLIAHEVQEASRTQVATGTKDGAEMQAMDYSNSELIANLIAEVKSLRQRVATLESK